MLREKTGLKRKRWSGASFTYYRDVKMRPKKSSFDQELSSGVIRAEVGLYWIKN